MQKIVCLIFISLYTVGDLAGQSDFNNHQKYWYLRAKLRNDFMKIGPNQGESMPFVERGYTSKVDFNTPGTYNFTTFNRKRN